MLAVEGVHKPVLRAEVLALAAVRPGERWVDCTLGFGGHTSALLDAGAHVTGLDQDPAALAAATRRLEAAGDRFTAVRANFRDLVRVVEGPVDGVLADIGVSSWQLDQAERGFAFSARGPVDMRMDPDGAVTALSLLQTLAEAELAHVLADFGEEPFAGRIARALKTWALGEGPHDTTRMAQVVAEAIPRKVAATLHHHPATRTFQALRIAVNDELGELERGLAAAERILAPGGRLAVVSFHSLEDRVVKGFLKDRSGEAAQPSRHLPQVARGPAPSFTLLHRKAVRPGSDEAMRNPRARSAKLRAAIRTEAPAWASTTRGA